MSKYHVVQQGEHLARIAYDYGFTDYRTIWNHPENAALKQERQNPNVLYPGDRLFIPDRDLREEQQAIDAKKKYVIGAEPLRLRVRFEKMYEGPVAGTPCELRIGTESVRDTTDGGGRAQFEIPATLEGASFHLSDKIAAKDGDVPLEVAFR